MERIKALEEELFKKNCTFRPMIRKAPKFKRFVTWKGDWLILKMMKIMLIIGDIEE